MSAQKREADEVPYIQCFPLGCAEKDAKAWRYRRRIMPKALAKHLGKTEWKSPIFKHKWQAEREAERLKLIHDEIIGRWRNGQAVDDAPEFAAAVEAKAQHLLSLRPEAFDDAIAEMQGDAFSQWAKSPGVAAAWRYFEERRGGPITLLADPPFGPFDVSADEFLEVAAQLGATGEMAAVNLAALRAAKEGGIHRPQTMPLSRAYARDVKEYGGMRDEKRIKYAVDAFTAAVGDVDFFALKRAHVEKWVKLARARGWSDATVKRRTVALQGIHSRLLIAFDLPASSVWRKLGLNDAATADDRVPLNAAHLKALDSPTSALASGSLRIPRRSRSAAMCWVRCFFSLFALLVSPAKPARR